MTFLSIFALYKKKYSRWFWTPVLFYASTAIGQSAPDTGALQRQLQLQLERTRPAPNSPSLPPTEPRTQSTNVQKLKINGFIFQGNKLQSQEELSAIVAQWTEREVLFAEMPDVTTAIQDAYAKIGRIAVANIPPQEVKDGLIVIEILEAKLARIHVDTDKAEAARFRAERARRFMVERNDGTVFINTKSFERAVTLINELSGVRAEGAFEAGAEFGFSDIRVKLTDGPLFSGQVATSNYGSTSTGNIQAIANLSLNNPFGRGDQITLDAIQSIGSTYVQAAYTSPIGFDGWKLGAQASYLTYQTTQGWGTPQTSGTGNSFAANASYALVRSQSANSTLRFSLENRNYLNTQLNTTISDYQINALTASILGNLADSENSSLSYSVGLTLGSLTINSIDQYTQDTNTAGTAGAYQKLSFNLSRTQAFPAWPGTTWQSTVYGQLASKNLNSSEQIYLGGPYAIRAYPVAQGGGSQGLIFSNELQYRIDPQWQVGAFIDVGVVQQYVNTFSGWQGLTNANNVYALGATGLTTKFNYKALTVSTVLAMRVGENPLYTQAGQQLNSDNANKSLQAWIRAQFAF